MTASTTGTVTDEDVLVVPSSWHRTRLPRRGGVDVRAGKPDPAARTAAADAITAHRQVLDASFRHPDTDPELGAAGLAYLAGDPTPLGAAAVAVVVADLDRAHPWAASAELWLADHGLEFAARTVVELVSVRVGHRDGRWEPADRSAVRVNRRDPAEWFPDDAILSAGRPVRAALATASEADYVTVTAALTGLRADSGLDRRVATSFLDPTRTGVVDADCAEVALIDAVELATLMVAVVGTAQQAAQVVPLADRDDVVESPVLLTSFADGLGPAAADTLADWYDQAPTRRLGQRILSVLAVLPSDAAFQRVLDRCADVHVRPVLTDMAIRFPRRALRLLAATDDTWAADLLHTHAAAHPDLVAELLPTLPPDAATRVHRATAVTGAPPPTPGAVPELLLDPPWVRAKRRPVPVVTGLVCADEPAVHWLEGEREKWYDPRPDPERPGEVVRGLELERHPDLRFLLTAREDQARPLVADWRPGPGVPLTGILALIGRFELDALPVAIATVGDGSTSRIDLLMPYASPQVALLMLQWVDPAKWGHVARNWLTRHPDAAARALVPPALGRPGPKRRQAEDALLTLAGAGHADAVHRAAQGYGPPAAAAVTELLSASPLDRPPVRIPKVPAWADPTLLPPLRLADGGGELPAEAVGVLLTMLAMSGPGEPYPGLPLVLPALEPASRAGFGWALFERWQAAGSPPRQIWALHALGWLGDDDVARRLAALIAAWPGGGGHNRAVAGLDVLEAIGSEVALMYLHRIAHRSTFERLSTRAFEKVNRVAERLGLTFEQLADRLVPDFGLDAAGTLTLDYGPRRFTVGFDEQVRPFVTDGAGKRLTALPKPGTKDDPGLAPAAYQRFAGLKKDVRTVADDQVRRFEQAMVWQRRWSVDEFHRFLAGHPLLGHVVRRLVWTVHDAGGAVTGAVRVAEDGSLADVRDEQVTLADDALVSVAHPVHLGDDLPGWVEVFADYGILQPFAQLGRPVHRLTDTERQTGRLTRYDGRRVSVDRILSLSGRGWYLDSPEDGGMRNAVVWGRHDVVFVDLDPGVAAWDVRAYPQQRITGVRVERYNREVTFGDLEPAVVSEVLDGLDALTVDGE